MVAKQRVGGIARIVTTSGGATVNTPTGWTLGNSSGTANVYIFYHQNANSMTTVSTTTSINTSWTDELVEFSGLNVGAPGDGLGGSYTSGSTAQLPMHTNSTAATTAGNGLQMTLRFYNHATEGAAKRVRTTMEIVCGELDTDLDD